MTDPEETFPPQRRTEDPRIAKLVTDVEQAMSAQHRMQVSIDENTALTSGLKADIAEMKETVGYMHDVLASFRTLGVVAKWAGVVSAAIGSMVVAWRQIKG